MKTLKKKDLVAVLLEEYRTERNDWIFWIEAKKNASPNSVLDYDYIIAEHYNRAYSLQNVLLSYGYTLSELVDFEISKHHVSEFVK